jgi:hypothetical protein
MPAGKSVSQSGLICLHRQIHLHLKHFVAVFAAKVFSFWRDAPRFVLPAFPAFAGEQRQSFFGCEGTLIRRDYISARRNAEAGIRPAP